MGFSRQIVYHPFSVLFFIVVLTGIDVRSAKLQHAIVYAGEFMGGGGNRFRRPQAGFLSPEIGAKCTFRVVQAVGSEAEYRGCPVHGRLGFAAKVFPTRDLR